MSVKESKDNSVKMKTQWKAVMKKFSALEKEERNTISIDFPRLYRTEKQFPTGTRYEGTWDLLGMSGYGIYNFNNGVIYEGEFDDGMFDGQGKLRYPNGIIIRGKWKEGQLIDKTLIFSDGVEYSETDWNYLKLPDRRFPIERKEGVQSAGRSFLTPEQPTRTLPPGWYDTGDGFYDPKTKIIFKPDDVSHIIRFPSQREQKWIIEKCRSWLDPPVGPCSDLYEKWSEPRTVEPNPPVFSTTTFGNEPKSKDFHSEPSSR